MDWRALGNTSILVTAVVYGLLFKIAATAGLFGIWLLILLIPSLWRYSYSVLRKAAQGRSDIPPPDMESLNPINDLILIAHFVALPALAVLIVQTMPFGAGALGYALGGTLVMAIVFAFPASAAIMGLTSNLVAALSPAAIGSVIGTFGRDYVILVGACLALGLLSALLQVFVLPTFGLVSSLLAVMLEVWTFLALFVLIGSSIHSHGDAFAIPGIRVTQEEYQEAERRKDWRATLDLVYTSIRGGLVAEGYRTLRQFVAENGNSVEVQYWLVERMLEWENSEHALRVAARLLEQLVEEDDLTSAFELYRRCRRVSGDFSVRAEPARKLADFARDNGHEGIADELSAELGPGL